MAAALIAHVVAGASGDNDNATTASVDTTGATLLIAFCSSSPTATIYVPTDNKSNAWVCMGFHTNATSTMRLAVYVSVPSSVGSGHTFSLLTTNGVPTIGVFALSGTYASYASSNSSGATTMSTGTVTLPQQAAVILTACTTNADRASTIAVASGFTLSDNLAFSSSEHFGLAMAHNISAAADTETPDWTWTTSAAAIAMRIVLNQVPVGLGAETSRAYIG